MYIEALNQTTSTKEVESNQGVFCCGCCSYHYHHRRLVVIQPDRATDRPREKFVDTVGIEFNCYWE